MRKFLLSLVVSLACLSASAQATKPAFCDVVIYDVGIFKEELTVIVDIGANKRGYLINDDGSAKVFNSPVDVLNFFGELGWAVSQTYFIPEFGQKSNVLHFLLMKQVARKEDAIFGLNIKNNTNKKKATKKAYERSKDDDIY